MKAIIGAITLAAALNGACGALGCLARRRLVSPDAPEYYANSIACNASINAHKVITTKELTTCSHGVVVEPNRCPSGQLGVIVDGGHKGSKIVNNYTQTYSLHVGAKPVLLKARHTEAQADKGCRPTASKATAVTTTTISTAAAGSAYLADAAPANAVLTTFGAKAAAWTNNTTSAQAEADAQPAITALQTLDTALTNAQWPSAATADVHTLIGDVGALIGDLQGLSTVNLLSGSSFVANLKRDLASLGTAVALVRHDLGLLPLRAESMAHYDPDLTNRNV